jgi:hypothetical protein
MNQLEEAGNTIAPQRTVNTLNQAQAIAQPGQARAEQIMTIWIGMQQEVRMNNIAQQSPINGQTQSTSYDPLLQWYLANGVRA